MSDVMFSLISAGALVGGPLLGRALWPVVDRVNERCGYYPVSSVRVVSDPKVFDYEEE